MDFGVGFCRLYQLNWVSSIWILKTGRRRGKIQSGLDLKQTNILCSFSFSTKYLIRVPLVIFIFDLMRLYCLLEWGSVVGSTLVSICFLITTTGSVSHMNPIFAYFTAYDPSSTIYSLFLFK